MAVAGLDHAFGLHAFTGADRSFCADVAAGDQAPPGRQVVAAMDGPAGLDAAGRIDFLVCAHVAAGLDALAALDGALRLHVLAGMQVARDGQVLAGADVPLGAHIAAAVQARGGFDAPVRGNVSACAQVAAAGDVGRRSDVFPCHDRFARPDSAARDDAAAGAHHAVHVDAHAHFQRAREHDRVGVHGIQLQHGVGGAELVQQPAGVADAAVGHQRVKHGLVVPLSVVVADEPFVTARAGVLGFDEFLGELHGAERGDLCVARPPAVWAGGEDSGADARPRGRASAGAWQAATRTDVQGHRRQAGIGRGKSGGAGRLAGLGARVSGTRGDFLRAQQSRAQGAKDAGSGGDGRKIGSHGGRC